MADDKALPAPSSALTTGKGRHKCLKKLGTGGLTTTVEEFDAHHRIRKVNAARPETAYSGFVFDVNKRVLPERPIYGRIPSPGAAA
jgi:hypothetical protein